MTNYKFGLIGYPVSHSLSPKIHQAALDSLGMKGSYKLFPVLPLPEGTEQLADILSDLRKGDLKGLNITIPHKQNILELVDQLSPTAKAIGAVNTIYFQDNMLIGGNTDAPAFLSSLKSSGLIDMNRPRTALVFGAGGSARAVIYALAMDDWKIFVASRRIDQAQELIQSMESHFPDKALVTAIQLSPEKIDQVMNNCQLLVNTTPVGMFPNVDNSPWPAALEFPTHLNVYDLIYTPKKTQLCKVAESVDAKTKSGLDMLVEQAAISFELWTGKTLDRAILHQAINPKH